MESNGGERRRVWLGLAAGLCSLGVVIAVIRTARLVALARLGIASPLDVAFWAFVFMILVVGAVACFMGWRTQRPSGEVPVRGGRG